VSRPASSAGRLRVGIVGCGEAAQIMHLPGLRFLSDLFQVTAVCDISRTVAERVGREWDVPVRLVDHAAAVALDEVDAVLVATPDAYHCDVALAAIAAGKHVLVEKPLCMTLREADEIAAAQERAGVVVQVGYMRRYAPAFLEAVRAVAELGEIRLAHVQHVLGLNRLVVEPTSRVIAADDIPDAALEEGRELRTSLLAEATGNAPPQIQEAYALLLSLASHDLSAMRELLGRPEKALYAATWHDAWYVTGAFDYGSFVCHFAAGFDRIPRVDATIEVFGERRVVRVRFDASHVRNLPVRVTVTDATPTGGVEERTIHPGWGDPFVEEWRAFHAHVIGGTEPKTSPADFREDLELFRELAAAMAVRT
jgi:predicted dehydrogenase